MIAVRSLFKSLQHMEPSCPVVFSVTYEQKVVAGYLILAGFVWYNMQRSGRRCWMGQKRGLQWNDKKNGLRRTRWGCYDGCAEWHVKTRSGTNTAEEQREWRRLPKISRRDYWTGDEERWRTHIEECVDNGMTKVVVKVGEQKRIFDEWEILVREDCGIVTGVM